MQKILLTIATSFWVFLGVLVVSIVLTEERKPEPRHESIERESGYWFDELGPHLKPFLYNPKEVFVIDEMEA